MDAAQAPGEEPRPHDHPPGSWPSFARRLVKVFVVELVLVFAFFIVADPFDSGRFPTFAASGVLEGDWREADVSRGRDPRFDAAIIGNSHLLLLDPKRLSAASGASFVQLAAPAERKLEDAAIIGWFLRNHKKVSALVINADVTICERDPALPLVAPFPFWLYGSDAAYLPHILSARLFNSAFKRISLTFRGGHKTADPSGPVVIEKDLAFGGPPPEVHPPPIDLSPALLSGTDFPAIDRLEAALEDLPADAIVIFISTPVHVSAMPQAESSEWREIKTCKYELTRRVAAHANWRYLDYLLDTPQTRDTSYFLDNNHYRAVFARRIEADIAETLQASRSGAQIGE